MAEREAEIRAAIIAEIYLGVAMARAAGVQCGSPTGIEITPIRNSGRETPRKRPEPKSPEELTEIRTRAWATRRAKYGPRGHR